MESSLKKQYQELVVPKLIEEFGYKNKHAVPKVEKVTLNVGIGKGLKDDKYMSAVEDTLVRITGQKPVQTKARKSIASFKIREGMIVGMKVTLRGRRMYDFLEKLINITFARVRDFRGLDTKGVDKDGNFSCGFTESLAFPEIRPDEVEMIHGLEVNVTTTAKTKEEGLALLKNLGFPFKEKK